MLHSATIAVNFVGLIIALWLGLYLVTRSPRRPEARLLALALWSTGAFFLNQLLALYPPHLPSAQALVWLRPLLPFWPGNIFGMGWVGWLQGWLPTFGIMFWHHATLHMIPGAITRSRLLEALAGYGLAAAGVVIQARFSTAWVTPVVGGDPLFSNALRGGPLFALFAMAYVTFAGLSTFNLAEAQSALAGTARRPYQLFMLATLLAAATGVIGLLAGMFALAIPQALSAVLLLGAVLLASAAIARYSALLDPKPPRQDFVYIAAEAAVVLPVYVLIVWVFTRLYPLPTLTVVWFGCLAVITHSLVDAVRLSLDRVLYQGKRSPGGYAGAEVQAPREANSQLGDVVQHAVRPASPEAPALAAAPAGAVDSVEARLVEQGLRHLHDYAFLADTPLAQLRLVQLHVESRAGSTRTHIELGKAVSAILTQAVARLRPEPSDPALPLPRNWHPYHILWQAYVECEPNAEITARLYISEGTFNRTRRTAIRSVARLLDEMEASLDRAGASAD